MIKVGIIGLGYWGTILYNSLSKNENFEIVKVCGRKNNGYGDIFTTNHHEVAYSDADLIVIATQTKYHYQHSVTALRYKKHVFVEKPISLTSGQAKSLIDMSDSVGSLLFVDHIYSTNPYITKIKEILSKDDSKLLEYQSLRFNEKCTIYDTSIIENLMYHDFYIVNDLIGDINVTLKNASVKHTPFKRCELNSGPIKLVSSYDDKKTRQLKIITEKNEIYWDEIKGTLTHNDNEIIINSSVDNINHKFNDIYYHIKNNVDDGSKGLSSDILKYINKI